MRCHQYQGNPPRSRNYLLLRPNNPMSMQSLLMEPLLMVKSCSSRPVFPVLQGNHWERFGGRCPWYCKPVGQDGHKLYIIFDRYFAASIKSHEWKRRTVGIKYPTLKLIMQTVFHPRGVITKSMYNKKELIHQLFSNISWCYDGGRGSMPIWSWGGWCEHCILC